MKKLIVIVAGIVASATTVLASASRGAAAYYVATQNCVAGDLGQIVCTPKPETTGIAGGTIFVIAAVAIGIYLWQKKKK